ncbi:MAG: right-handed parallel beta-helix repeat-containing protein [Thermomicrobiales bacterium]
MDSPDFDALCRFVDGARSRRALAQAAIGAVLAGGLSLVGGAGEDEIRAKGKSRKKKKHFCLNGKNVKAKQKKKKRRLRRQGAVRGRCHGCSSDSECPSGQVCANGVCGPCTSSAQCPAGSICAAGVCTACTITCTADAVTCGTALATAIAAGGDIYVCPGTYEGLYAFTSSASNSLNLYGAGDSADSASNTILDGGAAGSVVSLDGVGAASLMGVRITNGLAANSGAVAVGSPVSGTTVTIDGCTLTDNHTTNNAGAIYVVTSNLTVRNSTFSDNTVTNTSAGAIYYYYLSTGIIENSVFSTNSATYGGALLIEDSEVTVSGSTFTGNTASDTGGAIYLQTSTLTLDTATKITGNTAVTNGGGIFGDGVVTFNQNGATITANTSNNCAGTVSC